MSLRKWTVDWAHKHSPSHLKMSQHAHHNVIDQAHNMPRAVARTIFGHHDGGGLNAGCIHSSNSTFVSELLFAQCSETAYLKLFRGCNMGQHSFYITNIAAGRPRLIQLCSQMGQCAQYDHIRTLHLQKWLTRAHCPIFGIHG